MGIGFLSGDKKKDKGRTKVGEKAKSLTPLQRKYLTERLKGNSKKLAALMAGYSPSTANNATVKIETPALRDAFTEMLGHVIPEEKLALRLAEGIDATRTEFSKFEGAITDFVECVDFEQRRKYLELAAEWTGRVAPRGSPQTNTQVNLGLKVVVEHIGTQNTITAQTK